MTTAADTATASSLAEGSDPLLELKGITKRYGNTTVLDSVDLQIGEGEVVGLLGDNGAGKSTLVKIMSGVVVPEEGIYQWRGKPLAGFNRQETERNGVETIFQDSALVPQMSITRNIFMGREITNALGMMQIARMNRIAAEILDSVVTIEGIKSPRQLVGSLSGGQAQAVAIARAVHFKRSLLILDEPTSALAVRATEALLSYLEALREEGVSSLLVTHNLHHAYQVCDRHIVMNHGEKILDVRREDTSVEQLTAAVVEGSLGLERFALGERALRDIRRDPAAASLHDSLVDSGMRVDTRVLTCETVPAPSDVAAALGVGEGTDVVHIERVRSADGSAFAILRNWLTTDLAGELTTDVLSTTGLYDWLRTRGVELGKASMQVGARTADNTEAAELGLRRGASLVTVRRVQHDTAGRVVELGTHCYDSDQYSIGSEAGSSMQLTVD